MKDFLEKIAAEENCELDIDEQKHSAGRGTFVWGTTYRLNLIHKSIPIRIKYSTGSYAMAEITAELPKQSDRSKFTITTRSHFRLLFSMNKERIIVNCTDSNLKQFFEENNSVKMLRSICKEASFEPYFTGFNSNGSFLLRMDYNLLFEERNEVLRPIINLYKSLIDRMH